MTLPYCTYIIINPVLLGYCDCHFCYPTGQISLEKDIFNIHDKFTWTKREYINFYVFNLVTGMFILAQNDLISFIRDVFDIL